MIIKAQRQEKNNDLQSGRKIKLVALNAKFIHSCLALFYVRNELRRNYPEAEIEILQLTINDNMYESLLRITEDQPFGVFFSAAIWNSDKTEQLVRDVRNCLPDCRIVVGGPQAGVLSESLEQGLCSMVVGEFEGIDPAFYADLDSGELKPKYQGSFFKLPKRTLDYPFCEDDFEDHLKNRHIYYETSRGCPYACTYCLSAAERGLFHKDLEQVKAELLDILKYKPKVVRFVDRTFNDIPERAYAIWEFLIEQDCDTLFHFEIAPDRFSEEMHELLKKVEHGRFQFEIGIQSTNDETLTAIRRRIDKVAVHPIIKRLAELNTIHLHVDLILGLPYETEESFARSFADVFAMGAHYIQMGLLKILPDTPICHGADEYGYRHSSHPPYSIFANKWLNHEQVSELYWLCECVEKFYNNRYFVSFWAYLRLQDEDIYNFFSRLLEVGERSGFLHRALTQETLCSILYQLCQDRSDRELIVELLRYDWLRCGFRKLPDFLDIPENQEDMVTTRDLLFKELPDNFTGVFAYKNRNQFFKRSVFLKISNQAARFLQLDESGAQALRIAFLQEREKTLYGHNSVLSFPAS
ncbi:B12-binding domain-containing radical SAM protein [Desulfosediminicola ganghwensis]|uniref:B12-binding domain-containing radical SAM protein n=1 Tax=Desulfosediminicola ganghwensis TaxID=2569540 RepID=UPI0010AC98F2|nr:B12-binding domain-containing radical SAM protein [Desulfosediminicola ganghwensis]